MFEPLGTPLFMLDEKKGVMRSPVIEILIFFLLTFVAQLVQSALTMPYQLFYIFSDDKYFEIASSGDAKAALEYSVALAERMMAEPLFQLFMLFSTYSSSINSVISLNSFLLNS